MVRLLGFNIIDGSKEEYIETVLKKHKNGESTVIISGNPEILNTALSDDEVKELCRESDIIPDGIGVIIAGKITKQPFTEKIAGIEVMEGLLKASKSQGISIYMLGAEDAVVKKAADTCIERYGSIIAGYHNGFFDMENCGSIIDDINRSGADAIFIAMGCPRQERFIVKYRASLKPKIYMGVGGSLDVIAGKVNRAPSWMIKMGLEWLYRVLKEPSRIVRLTSIPVFLLKVIFRNMDNKP